MPPEGTRPSDQLALRQGPAPLPTRGGATGNSPAGEDRCEAGPWGHSGVRWPGRGEQAQTATPKSESATSSPEKHRDARGPQSGHIAHFRRGAGRQPMQVRCLVRPHSPCPLPTSPGEALHPDQGPRAFLTPSPGSPHPVE